jgi:hypothetical protein
MLKFVILLNLIFHCFYSYVLSLKSLKLTKSSNVLNALTTENERKIIAPKFEDSCERTGITLSRYMIEAVSANPHIKELESVGIYQTKSAF